MTLNFKEASTGLSGHVVGNLARALVRAATMGASWPLEILSNADRPKAHMVERVGMFRGQGISTIIQAQLTETASASCAILVVIIEYDGQAYMYYYVCMYVCM